MINPQTEQQIDQENEWIDEILDEIELEERRAVSVKNKAHGEKL